MSQEPAQGLEQHLTMRATQRPMLAPSVATRLLARPALLSELYRFAAFVTSDMRCVYVKGAIGGRTERDLLGACFLDALPRESHEDFREAFTRARACGGRCAFDCRHDDELLSMHLIPLEDEPGDPLMLVVRPLASEPSYRERARDRRLRDAVEASGVGTWSWDLITDTVAWDDPLCRIYGLPAGQSPRAYGDYVCYLHPDDRPRIEAMIRRCMETGVYEDFEHRLIRPDGDVRHVFCRGAAELDDRGRVIGMSGGIFDVTERKRLEENLRHVQKMQAIGQLAAGTAHNFNNLLTSILSNTELCRSRAPTSLHAPLTDIEHAVSRAAELVRQLMLFSRREVRAAKCAVDLATVVERILSICRATFEPRIAIERIAEPDLPPALGCAGEIEQVLLNVCINARDALEEVRNTGPRIELRMQRGSARTVKVSVIDNGPGMDEATRSRLFEPFFTTKGVGRGTGLGLASAYAIVADHNGTLRCESTPGAGAVFTIELPIAEGIVTPTPAPSAFPDSRGDETILLIDDEPLVRRAVRASLEHAGFRVLEAADGREGLATLQRTPGVALVLLDRSMPHMSGEELLDELRVQRPGLPVILLTGHPGADVEVGGPFMVITKPPRTAVLLSAIRRMLDQVAERERSQ